MGEGVRKENNWGWRKGSQNGYVVVQLPSHFLLSSTTWKAHRTSLSFTVSWNLLRLMSTESMMPTISFCVMPFSSCPLSFPASGSFLMSQLFASGGQSFGASASASVFPMYIKGWFPLGLTGLISLMSKGLWRVFSSTTVQKHQFFGVFKSCYYLCLCLCPFAYKSWLTRSLGYSYLAFNCCLSYWLIIVNS